jgi:hypothetical protein
MEAGLELMLDINEPFGPGTGHLNSSTSFM